MRKQRYGSTSLAESILYSTLYFILYNHVILLIMQIFISILVIMKICNKCNAEKPLYEFTNTKYKGEIKKRPTCKKCTTLRTTKWVEQNKDKRIQYITEYSETNKEQINKKSRDYYANNRRKVITYNVSYKRNRRKIDEVFRIADNVRKAILKSFSKINHKKNTKTLIILDCSFEYFKTYIESKFETWMNWSNYGLYNGFPNFGWDIDHIEPISNAQTIEDVIRLNNHTNFQPLCSYINRHIKRDN